MSAALAHDLVPVATLTAGLRAIAEAAVKVAENSYCPYSGFCVGAALLHSDGTHTVGTNWENCVYQSVCAERSAIVAANANGKRTATAVAVWGGPRAAVLSGKGGPPPDTLCTPCGVCRQMLNEVAKLSRTDLDVVLVAFDGKHAKTLKLSTLLPADFGPKDVGVNLDEWAPLPKGH